MNFTDIPSATPAFADPREDLAYIGDVDRHGHMSMPDQITLAKDPSRSMVQQVTLPPNEKYTPPPPPDETVAMLKAAEIPNEVVRGALTWLRTEPTQTEAELAVLDATHSAEVASELRALWGGSEDKYRSNVQAIKIYLASLKPEERDFVMNARTPDGRALLNNSATLQRLLGVASTARPSMAGDIASDIAGIERFMRSNRAAYNKDEALQARYRQLLTRRGR